MATANKSKLRDSHLLYYPDSRPPVLGKDFSENGQECMPYMKIARIVAFNRKSIARLPWLLGNSLLKGTARHIGNDVAPLELSYKREGLANFVIVGTEPDDNARCPLIYLAHQTDL